MDEKSEMCSKRPRTELYQQSKSNPTAKSTKKHGERSLEGGADGLDKHGSKILGNGDAVYEQLGAIKDIDDVADIEDTEFAHCIDNVKMRHGMDWLDLIDELVD